MDWKMFATGTALTLALAGCGDNSTPAPATAPAPAAATDGGDVKAQADKLLADATQYVADHKWELADKAVTELEGMKAKLPAEYGPKIDQLKSGLATAKAAADKLPAPPKAP